MSKPSRTRRGRSQGAVASKGNVLVVCCVTQNRLRSAVRDHLGAFRAHSKGRVFYLNTWASSVPPWVAGLQWDLIVYHTSFLSSRWSLDLFAKQRRLVEPLAQLDAVRVALPQDEFIHTDALADFIAEAGIDWVFSVAPESQLSTIYRSVDRNITRFGHVLTGYLSDDTVARIASIVDRQTARPIAIGYRAWEGAPWLGRHGMLKRLVCDQVAREAPGHGLEVDVSTRDEDTLLGDEWFHFLASCKYTVGVEGGASILDADGSVKLATEAYLAAQPDATFDEVEAACFPGRDGELSLKALSPRHLEACATKTVQILIEGEYGGVLRPNEHYIPLRSDFSNLADLLESVRRDDLREAIAERAYRDVVLSGRYSYAALVRQVEESALGRRVTKHPSPRSSLRLLQNRLEGLRALGRIAYRNHAEARLRITKARIRMTYSRVLVATVGFGGDVYRRLFRHRA